MQLSETKTRIAHTLKKVNDNLIGFNFLGFHVRQFKDRRSKQGFKTLIMPSKEAQSRHIEAIRRRIRSAYAKTQKELIGMLNPVIAGWCEYYRKSVAAKIFSKMKHQVFKMTWSWACRRHPKKGKKWVMRKYYREIKGCKWRFVTHDRENILKLHSNVKITRHVKVQGDRSPFDGDKAYWEKSNERKPKCA